MNELALFAGAGGGILGGHLLGWRTVCAVERDAYAAAVLAQRQNDGLLQAFPIWSDVTTFDGKPWQGIVDVISGGFPCQDISSAGKGAGITGERSGLWKEFARIIGEVRPRYVFVENSPMLTSRGLGVVLGDLASMGFDAEWGVVSAENCGAPHKRERIWVVGNTNDYGQTTTQVSTSTTQRSDSDKARQEQASELEGSGKQHTKLADTAGIGQQEQGRGWFSCDPSEKREGETNNAFAERVARIWGIKPGMGRVVNGIPHRMDRLKAIGNAQVSSVAATAFRILTT